MRFHINPESGNAGKCAASEGNCPFGPFPHYTSQDEARAAYEAMMAASEYLHTITLDSDTEKLLQELVDADLRPLLVGGTVRDSLLADIVPKDIDLEIHGGADMDMLIATLESNGHHVDEVGKEFGILKTTLANGMEIDLSLPRKENRVGAGHRGFTVEVDADLSVADAAARREFTISALYYDHARRVIIDPHGGTDDLKNGVIRHVSDAYVEDPLRVLRAMQFASRFNLTMAPETAKLSRSMAHEYPTISQERVRKEWDKLFSEGKAVDAGLRVLQDSGWAGHFGLATIDVAATAARVDETLALADREGHPREIFGPAALALTLPIKDRQHFLKATIVSEREANRINTLSQISSPGELTPVPVAAWARQPGMTKTSVSAWVALHGPDMKPGQAEQLELVARAAQTWDAPRPDFLTGAKILEATGSKGGGVWVGKLLKEAAAEQDRGLILSNEDADRWLSSRLKASDING